MAAKAIVIPKYKNNKFLGSAKLRLNCLKAKKDNSVFKNNGPNEIKNASIKSFGSECFTYPALSDNRKNLTL